MLAILSMERYARRFNKPLLLWSGAIDTNFTTGNFIGNALRRRLYPRCSAFIAYGAKTTKFLSARGAVPERIFSGTQVVVPGWVHTVPAAREELGWTLEHTVLLFVGYLTARKGVEYLLRAYKQVRTAETRLVIVGDGPERPRLETLAENAADVEFAGHLEGEEKFKRYASADIFVLPTLHDPWPQVVLEAMYFGLPIITTDADGGAQEAIDQNGIIVAAGNSDALAAAIKKLIADSGLRQSMSTHSQAQVASFKLEHAVGTFTEALSFALSHGENRV